MFSDSSGDGANSYADTGTLPAGVTKMVGGDEPSWRSGANHTQRVPPQQNFPPF